MTDGRRQRRIVLVLVVVPDPLAPGLRVCSLAARTAILRCPRLRVKHHCAACLPIHLAILPQAANKLRVGDGTPKHCDLGEGAGAADEKCAYPKTEHRPPNTASFRPPSASAPANPMPPIAAGLHATPKAWNKGMAPDFLRLRPGC